MVLYFILLNKILFIGRNMKCVKLRKLEVLLEYAVSLDVKYLLPYFLFI